MESNWDFPRFSYRFPNLDAFIHRLVDLYSTGKVISWGHLEKEVNSFFTPPTMEDMESILPGWMRMASYSEGVTLVHVMGVFLGMYMLPEFQSLSMEQQDVMKWIILFHDIDKIHIPGKRDTMHAFRSGVVAARQLPRLGFRTTDEYIHLIQPWSEFTCQSFTMNAGDAAPTPDNLKLPRILEGIEQLFGADTPATWIVKTVLLHISLPVDDHYPTPAPLSWYEAKLYIDSSLLPLLRVMMLSDNEGWSLFDQERRKQQRKDTLAVFRKIEKLISIL